MPHDHGVDTAASDAASSSMNLNRRMFLAMLGAGGAAAALNPRWFALPGPGRHRSRRGSRLPARGRIG